MADDLEVLIKSYSDDYLLEQSFRKRTEYSERALSLMDKEIAARNIPADKIAEYKGTGLPSAAGPSDSTATHAKEDFVPFDDLFSTTDILLVSVMFEEAKIPFFVDNPPSSVFPTEALAGNFLRIHVHKDHEDEAHALLSEHFVKEEGRYKVRFSNDRERLKALTFQEIHAGETLTDAEMGVVLAPAEIDALVKLARRLLSEVDKVEAEQERTVFYFDALDDLIERLGKNPSAPLRNADFLAVTEILQIYCDDSAFPPVLNETVAAILAFFEGNLGSANREKNP